MNGWRLSAFLSTLLISFALATSALAAPGDLTLVSTSDAGIKGNVDSELPSVSADGTKVAFVSRATNLDPADTDGFFDVYVKDLTTGDLTLASTSDAGVKGNGHSVEPSLSADGTKVAFASLATNLDPADTDAVLDVFVKELTTGDLTLASTSDAGVKGNATSTEPSLSAVGTKVAFYSSATNLDPADTDGVLDVYVKDLTTGDLTLASTSDAGVKGNGSSFKPALSADGTKVAFYSAATNLDPADTDGLGDVYVKDLVTGDLTLASTSDAGVKGNGDSFEPSLSADGTKVAFHSLAANLDPADTDAVLDVYVKELATGDLTLASTSDAEVKGNVNSREPALSSAGTKIAFWSSATNLDPADTDGVVDVYVKDLTTGDLTLASTSDAGVKGNDSSFRTSLSADGTKVAFISAATNLDPADTDGVLDVYVKELDASPPPPQCADGIDNDGDGLTDFPNDPGCSSLTDDSESPDPPPAAQCSDGVDNDGDGLTDFPNDPGCSSTTDNTERNKTLMQCSDGIDNDGDGLTDFPNDPDCSSASDSTEAGPQCSDGVDNDGDGLIDFPNDSGCSSANDNSEGKSTLAQCSDGVDNDGDGLTDFPNDPGCSSTGDDTEAIPQCSDGVDNDGDGLTDFPNDPGCSSANDNTELTKSGGRPRSQDPMHPPGIL